jgi:large subunit ribosomal protein L18
MSLKTIKRRRLECKTDYVLRLNILKSKLQRIVIRRTNKYFIAQIVDSVAAQDKVILGVTSKDLVDHGWDSKAVGSLKSIPAGYLTGYLLAKKAKEGEYIVDLGMAKNHKGGRLYSVIAGLVAGGLKIHASEEVFPSEERLMGEGLKPEVKTMISKVKENLGGALTVKTEKKAAKPTKEKK